MEGGTKTKREVVVREVERCMRQNGSWRISRRRDNE